MPNYQLSRAQPSECGQQRTLNSVHGHAAARLQSNGNLTVWMSQISTEWREWLFRRWRGRCCPGGAAWGRECRRRSSLLPFNLSDTAGTSQDGSSLEFIAAIAGAIFRMQVAEGCGWHIFTQACWKFEDKSHQALFWCVDCFRAVLTLVQLVFGQLFLLVKENLQQLL